MFVSENYLANQLNESHHFVTLLVGVKQTPHRDLTNDNALYAKSFSFVLTLNILWFSLSIYYIYVFYNESVIYYAQLSLKFAYQRGFQASVSLHRYDTIPLTSSI